MNSSDFLLLDSESDIDFNALTVSNTLSAQTRKVTDILQWFCFWPLLCQDMFKMFESFHNIFYNWSKNHILWNYEFRKIIFMVAKLTFQWQLLPG